MVAIFKKHSRKIQLNLLFSLLLSAITLTARADTKAEELEVATRHLAEATIELDTQSKVCNSIIQVIPKSAFKNLNVPKEHLKIAFLYFHMKASNDCLKSAAGQYLIAVALYNHIIKNRISATEKTIDMNALVMMNILIEAEHEAKYLAVPASSRLQIEKIEEFSRPFDPFRSAVNAGLIEPKDSDIP